MMNTLSFQKIDLGKYGLQYQPVIDNKLLIDLIKVSYKKNNLTSEFLDRLTFTMGNSLGIKNEFNRFIKFKHGDINNTSQNLLQKLFFCKNKELEHSLFVCPECKDFMCGVYTAKIELKKTIVTWNNFNYYPFDKSIDSKEVLKSLSFNFDYDGYIKALIDLKSLIEYETLV